VAAQVDLIPVPEVAERRLGRLDGSSREEAEVAWFERPMEQVVVTGADSVEASPLRIQERAIR
jgi:hypothetical protein